MHFHKKNLAMEVELQVAVQFIISFLVNKCTKEEIDEFVRHLTQCLVQKFEGHWYPEKPTKGSAYRCISIESYLDSVLIQAAEKTGIDCGILDENLPRKLDLWVDPSEVSYRIGEHGSVIVIYKEGDDCVNSTSEFLAKVLDKLPTVVQQQPITQRAQTSQGFTTRIGQSSPLITSPQQIANNFNLSVAQRQLENRLSPTAKTFVSRNNATSTIPFITNRGFSPAPVNPLLNLDYLQKLQWPLLAASGYDPLAAQLIQNYLIMQELQRFETRRLALQSHYLKLQSMHFSKKQHHHHHSKPQSTTSSNSSSNTNRLQISA